MKPIANKALHNNFPEGFQVLCWNCNHLKYYEEELPNAKRERVRLRTKKRMAT